MKTSTIKMIATFAAVGLLSANVAFAKNNGGGGGGGGNKGGSNGNKSGFKISLGGGGGGQGLYSNLNKNYGGNNNGHCNSNNNNNNYNNGSCNGQNGGQYGQVNNQFNNQNLGQAFEPFHSSYVVLPGDSFFTVSLKEYGTSSNARFIARFNNMPENGALVLNQTLRIPSISANGQLSVSRAPAAESLQGSPVNNGVANFSSVNSGISSTPAPVVEAPRPQVNVGSTLLVDGQTFGDKQGAARLRVSGLSLPIEVLEWNGSSVKIHLPTVELTSATKADIEVVRADGSLASKTAIELSAPTEVALTK